MVVVAYMFVRARMNQLFSHGHTMAIGGFLSHLAVLWSMPATSMAQPPKKHRPPLEVSQPAHAIPWVRYADWSQTDWREYNTLAKLASPRYAPPPKLNGPLVGDPKKGEQLAYDRSRGGSCLACHVMGPTTPSMPGAVGPDLSTYAQWGRDDQWIFNYIYDARSVNPQSVMPPWGRHKVFTVEEIKDMVAFMKTLNGPPTRFSDPLENPATRPIPVEDRDNLDPFVNNAMSAIERAEAAWRKNGPSGKSCVSCHADATKEFKSWATTMPRYEPRLKKVMGVQEFVTRHARATTGDNWLMQSPANADMGIYLHYLANGTPFKVDTQSKEHKAALARANKLLERKVGQLNFACMDCHSPARGANKWIRGQYLGELKGQVDHFPLWRTSRSEIWDIRKRLQWCNVAVRANELPPDAPEYGDLELALTAISNGITLSAPGIRH